MITRLARLAVVVVAGTLLNAQAPSFEVASVKFNKTGESQSVPQMQPGRVTLINRTLRYLVQFAYSTIEAPLNDLQVVGGPGWTDTDRFDVLAKMDRILPPGPAAANLGRMMMRSLLAERFRLKVKTDSREVPVYALVLARPDGRLGPGLRRRAEIECEQAVGPGVSPPDPNGPRLLCGFLRGLQGNLTYRGVPISVLTRPGALTRDRIVVDRTNLTGIFDVDLVSAPDAAGNPVTDAPFVFTAVQEQLGLKLEPARAPVEVLVIEHAEKPTPD